MPPCATAFKSHFVIFAHLAVTTAASRGTPASAQIPVASSIVEPKSIIRPPIHQPTFQNHSFISHFLKLSKASTPLITLPVYGATRSAKSHTPHTVSCILSDTHFKTRSLCDS